jgi:hypothetical protein
VGPVFIIGPGRTAEAESALEPVSPRGLHWLVRPAIRLSNFDEPRLVHCPAVVGTLSEQNVRHLANWADLIRL